jgi:hypothetical protein
MTQWFNVDKKGLAKLMQGRSKSFILYELIQNAWDEASNVVNATITPIEGTRNVTISVEDDNPEGFSDLSHAYTLFAESRKKANANQRGRFNMGEKLVLALAKSAFIETTKGRVDFNETGRHEHRQKRPVGSEISLCVPMSRAEMVEIIEAARQLIPPKGIETRINGEIIPQRVPIAKFETTLATPIADDDGVLRLSRRKTTVRVYETAPGECAKLYEMGIPVVETGDKYHVDVQQKVPLNMDRDNVTPGYLREVRVAVLNATFQWVTKYDATETWVREACGDDRVRVDAVTTVIERRFGENAVAYDPSDPEANKISASEGRSVVSGGALSAAEWKNAKAAGVLQPAGKVTPSPKPYHPDGKPLNIIPTENWTMGMLRISNFAHAMAVELFGRDINVQFANEFTWPFGATYGPGNLTFNVAKLGHKFFNHGVTDEVIDLLIHEFGHHYSGDHLSKEYHDALTLLGAKFTRLALQHPELFA